MRNIKGMSFITSDNWSEKIYLHPKQNLFVRVTQGAEWRDNSLNELYFVTLSDLNHVQVAQTQHSEITSALLELNQKYSENWKFENLSKIDQLLNPSTADCDTCSAH